MRLEYDRKLTALEQMVRTLAHTPQESFHAVQDCLQQQSIRPLAGMAHLVRQAEDLFREIDRNHLLLILKEQPVASDLRTITLMQSCAMDLMRICAQLRELSRLLTETGLQEASGLLLPMACQVRAMVNDAVACVNSRSVSKAARVIGEDDRIDSMFADVRQKLVSKEAGETRAQSVSLLLEAKYLERIADQAQHMAENVQACCIPDSD